MENDISKRSYSGGESNSIHQDPNFTFMPKKEFVEYPIEHYISTLFKSSFPLMISDVCNSVTVFVCLIIIAEINASLVGPFGISMTFANALILPFLRGLSDGVSTLVSQAHGANERRLCGEYLNKGILIIIVFTVPWLFIMSFLNFILEAIGYNEQDSFYIGVFLRFLIPYYFTFGITEIFRRFLTSLKIFYAESIIYFSSLIIGIGTTYLLVGKLELGMMGAAIALDIMGVWEFCLFFLYTVFSKNTRQYITLLSSNIYKNWSEFLEVALPNATLNVTNLFLQTFLNILSGIFSSIQLRIQSCYTNLATVISSPCQAISSSMYSHLGNSIGEGDIKQAKKWCKISLISMLILYIILMIVCFYEREFLIRAFLGESESTKNVRMMKNVFYLFGIFLFSTILSSTLIEIFLGLGKLIHLFWGSIIIFLLVVGGLIGMWFLIGLNIYGLWVSLDVSGILFVIYYSFMLSKEDFGKSADNAHDILENDKLMFLQMRYSA